MSSTVFSIDTITITDKLFNQLMSISIPPQLVIEDGKQKMVEGLTWCSIFDYIKSEHWHQTKTHTCPHKESLYDHLRSCGNICYQEAKKFGYHDDKCVKAYLTGLLHDIGKPGTRRLLGKHTAFKGHGLVGGAMIENFYSPELCTQFDLTPSDWADISTCADVHMCSYFPKQTSVLHKYSANILPESVKLMLLVLRIGDQLSMVPDSTYPKSVEEIFHDVETNSLTYSETLSNDMQFSDVGKKKGVLIMVQGGSSSGKSTFCKELIDIFGSSCVHVNRDWYMVHWTLKKTGGNPDIKPSEITPEIYSSCHKKYVESDKEWAPSINNHMNKDIFDGLQLGKIVIVDTLATMFDSIEVIISDIAKDAYRISFWLHRNKEITEAESLGRLGMSLDVQFQAHGDVSVYNPFNKRINWMRMISATEGEDDSRFQSHLSISYGWTDIKRQQLMHLSNKINEMYNYNQIIPRVPVLDQTYDYTLTELIQVLRDSGGIVAIDEFFSQYDYTVSKYVNGAVGIKYIDGMNQIWKPKWAREARGRFYYIDDDKVVPIKDTLQRGIEVLTKAHTDGGIQETQDIDQKTLDKLDDVQGMIMKTFAGNNPIDSYLSGKVDGSLLIINVYPKKCEQYSIIQKLLSTHDNKYVKQLVDYCV
ncbi:MAG: HD domain-containing protein, partial [Alphaproteobacteria bacterium]|nr:HD domain-containing protein [Alphaproteobacteria bacterium]